MAEIRRRGRRRIPSAKMPSTRFQSNRMLSSRSESGAMNRGLAGVMVSSEEADAILQELAAGDQDAKKTWSRMFVDKYLSKYDWYWPRRNDPTAPQLSKAWAYYEHVTLPRHIVGEGAADTVMKRAEPGEHEAETELYDPFFGLKQKTFIEWGTGLDLYFISLKFFAILMLILGLINIASIRYYSVGDYNGGKARDVTLALKGSAICTNTDWVVCTDCVKDEWSRDKGRYATAIDENGMVAILVKKNFCQGAELQNGITNFVTLLVVLVAVGIFSFYLRLREIRFDEDKVTTTDYSVVVHNPPPDAIIADEWRDFFSPFATDGDQVTVVTVALNNHELVRRLLTRRIFSNQLRSKLPPQTDLEDEDAVRVAVDQYNREQAEEEAGCIGKFFDCILIPILNLINMLLPPDKLVEKIFTLTEEIKELQNEKYIATEVYVTFETEEGQRTALDALKVGHLARMMNTTSAVAPECLFDGRILQVQEPTEPNAVRWLDLSYGTIDNLFRRGIALCITLGMIVFAGYIIYLAREEVGPWFSGALTTIFNSSIPQIIKLLMLIEPHATEGAYQASLYLKITLFRWTLMAILTPSITPFTSTLGDNKTDVIYTIYAILLSECLLSPVLRLSDWMTNVKKHILAPRAKTQEEMNLNFQGTYYHMGERYTDFTKILFVVFYYSALFPLGFFFGFFILTLQYWIDRYSLVRVWGWTPLLGSELAVFSRRYFFTGATIALAIVSSLVWARFPYDNTCEPLEDSKTDVSGNYTNVTNGDNVLLADLYVSQNTSVVFCDQSWRGFDSFPPTPRIQTGDSSWTATVDSSDLRWMTHSQENLTMMYGWFTAILTFAFIIALFGRGVYGFVVSIFVGAYEPEGESQRIDFSSNPEIFAYVPQIKKVGQPFPYLACDIDDIDQGLIGWNDQSHSYDHYNLIFDLPHKSLRRTKIFDENTRGTTTIAGYHGYNAKEDPAAVQAVGTSPSQAGFEVNASASLERPIYSVVKHYPTKWQIELAEKEEQESSTR